MSSLVNRLTEKGIAKPPRWLPSNVHYEVIMGSVAYGVSSDTSDMDVYGICIPPKNQVFPHLNGEILGFGSQQQRFEQYQEHHLVDENVGKEYDLQIFSIIKFFNLAMDNNPNIIDALFVPLQCVLYQSAIGNMIRENRKLFLHKGAWHKFKGYAYSQLHKMSSKNPVGKRKALVEQYGYDVKFAYHVVRLLNEVEQIMVEGDIDLQKNNDQLKSIRRGEWKEEDIRKWAAEKELALEKTYLESKMPHSPDEAAIKQLLVNCLEDHYGNLSDCISLPTDLVGVLRNIRDEIQKVDRLIS